MPVTVPPDPFDPVVETWAEGVPLVRVHPARYDAVAFNPTVTAARFRPVYDANGSVVPTIYCAADSDAALSESIFHDVPRAPARRRVPSARIVPHVISTFEPTRKLRLAQFHGFGLGRLGVSRRNLIDTGRRTYPATAAWGEAVHRHPARLDGIVWMSRQFDSSKALLLFGDRVLPGDLRMTPGEAMIPLLIGRGYDLVADAANRAGIAIIRR